MWCSAGVDAEPTVLWHRAELVKSCDSNPKISLSNSIQCHALCVKRAFARKIERLALPCGLDCATLFRQEYLTPEGSGRQFRDHPLYGLSIWGEALLDGKEVVSGTLEFGSFNCGRA